MSFTAQRSGAQIWNPSSRISERRGIVAIRGWWSETRWTLLNRFDDLIAQELSEIFDPESEYRICG